METLKRQGSLTPEGKWYPEVSNFNPCKTNENACNNFSKQILNINKIFKFFAQMLVITIAIMVALKASSIKIGVLETVIKHYGVVQLTLVTLVLFCSAPKVVENWNKFVKSCKGQDAQGTPLEGKDRVLAISQGAVTTAIPIVDIVRGVAAIGSLVLIFTGKLAFSGQYIFVGLLPVSNIATVAKHSLKVTEHALGNVGAKAKESGSPEKTHKVTLALAATAGLAELILAIAKLSGVAIPQVWMLSIGGVAAVIGGFEAVKELSNDSSKKKHDEYVRKLIGTYRKLPNEEKVTRREEFLRTLDSAFAPPQQQPGNVSAA
jgi:hypothetical protein